MPEPRPLVEEFDSRSRHEVLEALVDTRVEAFERNRITERIKSRRLKQGLVGLIVAATVSGIRIQARSHGVGLGSEGVRIVSRPSHAETQGLI